MTCCADCLGDRGLKREIFPTLKTIVTGTCSYCSAAGVPVTEPIALQDIFETLVDIYERHQEGQTLPELLKQDWLMFPEMDLAHATVLLSDILNDGNIVREKFRPKLGDDTQELTAWNALREELMYKNRFFPQTSMNEERLQNLLSYIIAKPDELNTVWYRARIQDGPEPFEIDKMGAPPKRIASHGRANPVGIPYLYIASDKKTAVSEIRPHTGEIANLVGFSLDKDLTMVDLRNPRKHVSPFIMEGEQEIALLRRDIGFLEHLGTELMRPVLPRGAAIDYIPTQFLCEFIKTCGYDGVIYNSSMADTGINLALFDPQKATACTDVEQHKVLRVSVDI